ncbi:MAG: putative nucleotide-diphospho-sugar transferase [Nonlabens sp.]
MSPLPSNRNPEIVETPSIAFITFTNKGYLPYTLNCLKSLDNIGFTGILKCYALDKTAYIRLKDKGYEAFYHNQDSFADFESYKNGKWHDLMFIKFNVILENLKTNDYVCYTDGDVVFENKDFISYCFELITDKDLLVQNDTMQNDCHDGLCAGFMFIKSNSTTLNFFQQTISLRKSLILRNMDDQDYLNEYKSELNYGFLPLELFPNGRFYRENRLHIKPMMIHFNWMIGHEKAYWILYVRKWQSLVLGVSFFKLWVQQKGNRLTRYLFKS